MTRPSVYYIYKYLEHTFDLCFDRTRHEKAMFWIQNRGQLGSRYIIVVSPFWNLKKIPNTPKKAMVWEHIVFDLCHILVVHVRPWTTWTTGGLIFFLFPLILCIWILKSTELSNKHAHTHTHTRAIPRAMRRLSSLTWLVHTQVHDSAKIKQIAWNSVV